MGYTIKTDPNTGEKEILGDVNAAKKDLGLPHYTLKGRYVSQREIDEREEYGL